MSKKEDELKPQSIEVKDEGRITVRELFQGKVPRRPDLEAGVPTYNKLGEVPLAVYQTSLTDGTVEWVAIGEPLDGERVNALLYYAGPSRSFKYDTGDILKDWRHLYSWPQYAKKLEAHRQIPNWAVFEKERTALWTTIYAYSKSLPLTPDRYFVPVMAWRVAPDGQAEWIIEREESVAFLSALEKHKQKPGTSQEAKYSLLMGSVYAAAYAPDLTSSWGEHLSYHLDEEGRKQNMGSTQAMPLVLAMSHQLPESEFIRKLEASFGFPHRESKLPKPETTQLLLLDPEIDTKTPSVEGTPVEPLTENKPSFLFPSVTAALLGLANQNPLEEKIVTEVPTSANQSPNPITFSAGTFGTMFDAIFDEDGKVTGAVFTPPENIQSKVDWCSSAMDGLKLLLDEKEIDEEIYVTWMLAILKYLY